jgi:NADH dehydrogenase
MQAKWARRQAMPFLFMPYFGAGLLGTGGAGKLQPVYVEDVARAFVEALDNPRTIGEIYPIAGPEQMTWPELHRAAAEALVGKKRAVAAVPVWYAKLLTRVAPAGMLPFNYDQVVMSQENNTCDITKFEKDFGWMPAAFEPTIRGYAGQV